MTYDSMTYESIVKYLDDPSSIDVTTGHFRTRHLENIETFLRKKRTPLGGLQFDVNGRTFQEWRDDKWLALFNRVGEILQAYEECECIHCHLADEQRAEAMGCQELSQKNGREER